jgi:hypothetical protein
VKKHVYLIAALVAAILLTSCAGVISFRNPKVLKDNSAAVADNKPMPPVKFEDFENGSLNGAYNYANTAGGASTTYGISREKPHEGQYCAAAIFNSGTDSDWGCGFGSGSTYGPYVDASGRNVVSVWAKCPANVTFYVFINESGANGADGEFWNSPQQTGSGEWQEYVIPFDELFRNIYSGVQDGNYNFDTSGLGTVGAQIGGAQNKGEMYVDDIYFVKR